MTATSLPDTARAPQADSPRRILIVDDEPIVAAALRAILRIEGYDVCVESSAADALATAATWRPDLVLSDVRMPGTDGYALTRELPRVCGFRVPVILLSGMGGEEDILEGFDAGAADYILKPWREHELLAKVRRHAGLAARADRRSSAPLATVGGGRYVLEASLGVGGMGAVYRGRDSETGEGVAIKLLRADLADQPEFVARFLQEARLLVGSDLPGVPTVYDVGRERAYYYYVMELVHGRTLRDRVRDDGPLPPHAIAALGAGLTAILATLEANAMVHRDVKPDNVLIDTEGNISLVDFGLARRPSDARLTAPDAVIGTAGYLAPEQLYGDEPPDIRGDLYGAAMTLWYAATGADPSAEHAARPMRELQSADFIEALGSPAAGLARLLARCAAHDPAQRPVSAAAAQQRFERVRARLTESAERARVA